MEKRIAYLKSLAPTDLDIEKKYFKRFEKTAQYIGNGLYHWNDVFSKDTAELF